MSVPAHRYWYPLFALVRRDIQKRYATTMLGLGWTVLQPLALVAVYVVVFGFILRIGRADEPAHAFVFFMLTGMLPYLSVADGIQRAASSLREDKALLDHADFPAEILVVAKVAGAAIAELAGLALLGIVAMLFGVMPTPWAACLPALVLLRIVMTCGYAWIVSTLSIFVTDLAEVLSLLLTAWLFLTPIFYRVGDVPDALRWMVVLNPLHHAVEAYRAVLLDGRAPWPEAAALAASSLAAGGAGLWFFRKTIHRVRDFL
jgi:ABC-type polysaccharide/polyol phosphate export permease